MNERCRDCRFLEKAGCSVGICGVVRLQMPAAGETVPDTPTRQVLPERMTPDGLIGFTVAGELFAPTVQGYIRARAHQGAHGGEIAPTYRFDQTPIEGILQVWDEKATAAITIWGRVRGAGPSQRDEAPEVTPEMLAERQAAEAIQAAETKEKGAATA